MSATSSHEPGRFDAEHAGASGQTVRGSTAIAYEIVTPTGRIAHGECMMIVAPAECGEVGILRNHAPFLAALSTGVLRVKHGESATGNDAEHLDAAKVYVSNGFIEVLDNKVIILAETAEKSDAIDVDRARKALERAKKNLVVGHGAPGQQEPIDRLRARRSFERAAARIKASGKG